MMKRKWKSVLAVIMTAVTTTACVLIAGCVAPPPDSDLFATEDLAEPVNVNISKDTTATIKIAIRADASEEMLINRLIAAFNEEYKNITVNIDKIPSPYETMLAAKVPAGNMPDLFWINPVSLPFFYQQGMAFAMNNYYKESGLSDSDYVAAAIASGKNNKGNYYMMPRDFGQTVLYYNKSLLKAAGVETLPADDWTWNDFLNICKQFKEKNIVADGDPVLDVELDWEAIYYPIIRSFGGDIVDSTGEVVLNKDLETNPSANAAYQYLGLLLEMKTKKYINSDQNAANSGTKFYAGKSPFYAHSRAVLSTAYESLGENLGVLPFPAIGETPKISAGATGYGMYRKSPNKDAAWAFLKFMLDAKGQTALAESSNVIPVLLSERDGDDAVWRQYPLGAKIDQSKFLSNSDRGIKMDFLDQSDPSTHTDALSYLRQMYTKVLYQSGNRINAIQVCADSIYNLKAYA